MSTAYAKANGGTTLEQYLKGNGITLPEYDKTDLASVKAWNAASTAFARGARGDVRVVLGPKVSPTGIWATVERSALENNSAVTSITEVNMQADTSSLIWVR